MRAQSMRAGILTWDSVPRNLVSCSCLYAQKRAVTIHGRSRYPGLCVRVSLSRVLNSHGRVHSSVWGRNTGKRIEVKVRLL